MLARTIIVENIDDAIKLASHFNYSYRIVTLEGEVLAPGGSMTGGSNGDNNISLISRRVNIENLQSEIEEVSSRKIALDEEKNIMKKTIEATSNIICDLEDKIKAKEVLLLNDQSTKETLNYKISKLKESKIKYRSEIETLKLELDNYKNDLNSIFSQVKEIDLQIEKTNEDINLLTKDFSLERSKREEESVLISDMKIQLNTLDNQINSLQMKIKNNLTEIDKNVDDISLKSEDILKQEEAIRQILDGKQELNKEILSLEEEEIATINQLNSLVKEKDTFMNKFYEEQNRLMKVNNEIASLEKAINQEEVRIARFSVQLENYHKRLSDDYELDYQEAMAYKKDIKNIQEANNQVRRLKNEIKELGNVNLRSIE